MAQARKSKTVRVAAAQFAVGVDVEANLAACLHWLREAGKCKPDLVVLPEFANHASWYDDGEHCYRVSVDMDGEFIKAIAGAAAEISAYVVVNCTVRGEGQTCTGTSVLISPQGDHDLSDDCSSALEDAGIVRVPGPCGAFEIRGDKLAVETAQGWLEFDSVYPALGSVVRSGLARSCGADVSEGDCILVGDHMETSVPGLFAAGDVVLGLDQISHAMGQAGVAATTIRNHLADQKPIRR